MKSKAFVAILAGSMLSVAAWAWAQQPAAPQPPPAGPRGQGMMGQQGGAGPGGMMGAQSPQAGQPAGPGAAGPRYGRGMHRGGMGIRSGLGLYERPLISEMLSVQQQLGLSPDQVQRLQTLRTEFEKEAIRRSAEIQVAQVDLSSLLEASQLNLSEIETQLKKIAGLQAELRFARIKTLDQGRAVLSQEQWQKFEALAPRRGPMGPYGRSWGEGHLGRGPYGMMGGYGPGGMMGGYGPGGEYGQRQFHSNGEQIYFTGVSQKDGYLPRTGGPPWAQRVGCVACHGPNGQGGVPVMMGTAVPANIQYKALLAHHYTDAIIERAISQGLDEDGKPLDWTMPRWQMSREDLNDLVALLKTLR